MKFDYTYIVLFGHPVFEPMVLLTNTIFFLLSFYFFKKLAKVDQPYGRQMAWFILMLGTSTFFGAIGHAVHYMLGDLFFNTVFFISKSTSLVSVYFCFKAAYCYYSEKPDKRLINTVLGLVIALILFNLVQGTFILIEIIGGLVLIYSLVMHILMYKRTHERGSRLIITGILISFLSLFVHLFKISLHENFNNKDLAHTIMIITLFFVGNGAILNAKALDNEAKVN